MLSKVAIVSRPSRTAYDNPKVLALWMMTSLDGWIVFHTAPRFMRLG
jgi:hypothetical protein